MRSIFKLAALAGVFLISTGVFLSPAAAAESDKPSVASFFQNPKFSSMEISPSGKFVGFLATPDTGRVKLGVIDLATMKFQVFSGFQDADVADFHWINDKRLVFSAAEKDVGQSDIKFYPGLFAIDRDGEEYRMLAERDPLGHIATGTLINARTLHGYVQFERRMEAADSDDIFVEQTEWNNVYDFKATKLIRMNTRTGISKEYDRPGDTTSYSIDNTDTPRVATTRKDGRNSVYYRDPETDKWKKIADFEDYDAHSFYPYDFASDGSFYVLSNNGKNFEGLYRYDLKKNAIDAEPIVNTPGYDFHGSIEYNRKGTLGIHYLTDAHATFWFDDSAKKIQKMVDALLPQTVNRLSFADDPKSKNVLVHAFSDVEPGMYLIYSTETEKLTLLAETQPTVDTKKMAQRDMVHYKARDGLEIPAYITMPNGTEKKNLPMVVLVHGGPWVRGGTWTWDPEAEFLASRGYVVLQPEFRGSTGFGSSFFHAGWKQWGLSMQDDVTDGAKWAIAQGIADPKRICIAGASYGGYATLMGLIKEPELFRCGVEWAGVTDINLMYSISWGDFSEDWKKYGMPNLIGDRDKDVAQLKATSPLENASRLKNPLLMAHGAADYRVPLPHGSKFHDAVAANNPNVEWIVYPEEGHGWYLVKNRVDFWTKVEDFLRRNIGEPAKQTASASSK